MLHPIFCFYLPPPPAPSVVLWIASVRMLCQSREETHNCSDLHVVHSRFSLLSPWQMIWQHALMSKDWPLVHSTHYAHCEDRVRCLLLLLLPLWLLLLLSPCAALLHARSRFQERNGNNPVPSFERRMPSEPHPAAGFEFAPTSLLELSVARRRHALITHAAGNLPLLELFSCSALAPRR